MRTDLLLMAVVAGVAVWTCAAPLLAAEAVRTAQQDLETVRERLLASFTEMSETQQRAMGEKAARWLRTMQQDGSWADQDYGDTDRERWKCGSHLPRLVELATAARIRSIAQDKQAEYVAGAVRALRFWLKADPRNTNWWHNEIGVPLQVGQTLILLGSDAPGDLRSRGAELMKRSKWQTWTGQNLVWGTRIQIIRACITGDADAAAEAFARMYEEVRVNGGRVEGVKPDWSFFQHGELLYSGGYGAGFTSDTARLALLARDTALAIPPEKLEILVSHLLDGQAWMTRGHYWDYSVTGREIVRKGKNARSMATPARDLAALHLGRKDELLALAARLSDSPSAQPLTGNRHYWYSDYMVHQRPEWYASVRMYSSRTKNTDPLINGESRKSHYLAEGVTYIMRRGGEYEDIFPVWDWHQIPGATIEQGTPFDPKTVSRVGREKFVGGVSDGMYGCATMDLATGALKAKKSWFFFDDSFVALGAGIECDSDNPVVTTINQCLLDGDVTRLDGERWFWHAGIGYAALETMDVRLSAGKRRGSWHEISSGASTEPVERDVFLANIEHGRRPQDGHYAYAVFPGATVEQTAARTREPRIRVLSNTPDLQAVSHVNEAVVQAVFRKPGSLDCGGYRVAVDHPCVLMVRHSGREFTVTAANPLNEALELGVSIAVEGVTSRDTMKLPGGDDAGKSLSVSLPLPE